MQKHVGVTDMKVADELTRRIIELEAERDALANRVAELEAVLRPFSQINSPQWVMHENCRRAEAVLRKGSA